MLQVSVSHIGKRFGATVALADVSLEIAQASVHGILGENGAGKSTLMKVLSGVLKPDTGTVALGDRALRLGNHRAARRAGIAMAYQELSSPSNIAVQVKLALPTLPRTALGMVSRRRLFADAVATLSAWEVYNIDPAEPVSALSLADRQRLEIVAALSKSSSLLILDEPTAALADASWLYRQIRRFTSNGGSVLYISHKMPEIKEVCDYGTVLRGGTVAGNFVPSEVSEDELIQLMLGKQLSRAFPASATASSAPTATYKIARRGDAQHDGVDLHVSEREIVGIAALDGQGQKELFYELAESAGSGSRILLNRVESAAGSMHDVARKGRSVVTRALVPEDRKRDGLFMRLPVHQNLVMTTLDRIGRAGLISRRRERQYSRAAASHINLNISQLGLLVNKLSGGNQQKVLLQRAMLERPDLLLLFDPTRGVDVGTKQSIYQLIREYADSAGAVLFYSTEIQELVGVCDRVYVMYRSEIIDEYPRESLSEELLLRSILGGNRAPSSGGSR